MSPLCFCTVRIYWPVGNRRGGPSAGEATQATGSELSEVLDALMLEGKVRRRLRTDRGQAGWPLLYPNWYSAHPTTATPIIDLMHGP